MKNTRRDFIRYSSLASASLLMPKFLRASAGFLPLETRPKVLVVIQFSGGNDGLNCVVPFTNDLYQKNRPNIGYHKDELIHLSDDIGLNMNLQGLADLFFDGDVVLINNVGYPNPNRSHFRSMDIWQTASDENVYLQSGWIGRILDSTCSNNCVRPHYALEMDDSLSLALKGNIMSGFAVYDPAQLKNVNKNPLIDSIAHNYSVYKDPDHDLEYLHKLLSNTAESTDYIAQQAVKYNSTAPYPQTAFAKQLKSIAELIIAETNTSIYYVSLSGFDTHALQRGQQERQLKIYGDALKVFCDDLKANNKFRDTMIMTFSEFGRRVEENAGKGTDHGTANNIYLISGGLKQGGMINDMPDLATLDNGDLIYQLDFRSVYSTIMNKWLNVDAGLILDKKFAQLDFI